MMTHGKSVTTGMAHPVLALILEILFQSPKSECGRWGGCKLSLTVMGLGTPAFGLSDLRLDAPSHVLAMGP
jgi:hypothetical protein